jgi:hypothetical protein
MDEMNMIRTLLAEAPPPEKVIAEGRQRLQNGDRPLARRRPRARWSVAGFGLTAVAACAAVAMGLGGVAEPNHGSSTSSRTMSAQGVLLAAASKAETEPVGRYWHTHVINGQAYYIASGGYVISGAKMEVDQWLARSDKDPDVFRSRFAGAGPQTPADTAAWKRAGAPQQWTVLSNGGHIRQTTQPEKWALTRTNPAQKRARTALMDRLEQQCPSKQKQCPPSQERPQALEKLISDSSALTQRLHAPAGKGGPGNVLTNAADLLAQPISAKARATVFRALAKDSSLRKVSRTRDLRGRTAIALVAPTSFNGDTFDVELLLAPGAYQLLGTETVLTKGGNAEAAGMKPGTVFTHQLFLEMGWTNSAYGG